tara:strand:- start:508 stop:1551 length:1044 start_codon:yes stop_codon:yes gene_type:complete
MSQVTNYVIDNAAGQVVRLDIQAIVSAIRNCNSGSNSGPPNPEKFMFFGKTDNNKLYIYDGSDFTELGDVTQANLGLLLKSGGTLTGALLADDAATHAAPAISFDGDSDTGFYRDAANTIGISTAGVERMIIDEHGITLRAQKDIRFGDADSSNYVALQSPATVSSNVTFSLPAADGNDGDVLKTNGSGALSFGTIQGVPTGSVFCMATSTVPAGYLECDGSEHEKTGSYSALFAVIGTTWGENGTKFKLPDLRGEFVRGWVSDRTQNGASFPDPGRAMGVGGHQSDQNKSHTHSYNDPLIGDYAGLKHDTHGTAVEYPTVNGGSTGSEGGTESRPRNFAMMYVIKT